MNIPDLDYEEREPHVTPASGLSYTHCSSTSEHPSPCLRKTGHSAGLDHVDRVCIVGVYLCSSGNRTCLQPGRRALWCKLCLCSAVVFPLPFPSLFPFLSHLLSAGWKGERMRVWNIWWSKFVRVEILHLYLSWYICMAIGVQDCFTVCTEHMRGVKIHKVMWK